MKAATYFYHYRNKGLYEDMEVIYLLESYAIYAKEIENMARNDFFSQKSCLPDLFC